MESEHRVHYNIADLIQDARITMIRSKFILVVILLLSAVPLCIADIDQLQRDFAQPPYDARIMMRWWWFGPAVTKSQLEREMKLMKEGGIGGFEVQPTYPLAIDDEIPGLRNFKFMSPEFLDALTFTADKAKELGLRMDLTLGSGWPYGGPQFPANEAAGRLRMQNVRITAGQSPPVRIPVPQVREGEKIFAAFIGPVKNVQPGENPYKEIEIRNNDAQLPEDFGDQNQVIFFIASQTGMKVKRAAYGAEGFVIDHYNPAVIDKFIKEIAIPAVKACDPNPPYAVFCDSLEVGGEDWTYNFLDEFKKRRGYDLRPYLPALFSDIGPKNLEIRHDWGKTITELFNDSFNTAFAKWAKANNTRFRIQGYGTPPAALYSYAFADLCEGEGDAWKGFRETRWASSANHLLGRQVTSSETWTWLHSPVFRATPLDMKAEADLHFLQGINQLIGHGWPYTAEGVEYPGWRFYAAGVFNEKNPWWIVMPDVAKYLQRVSYMMRQGTPSNDVALYLSNSDAWASFTPGRVSMNAAVSMRLGRDIVPRILESGYNLDFFDDGLLDVRGKVENGTLAFGDVRYKVVVLAGVERIPPTTIRKLDEFARGGGILITTRNIPSLAPGLKATEDDQKTVQTITQRLFKDQGAPGIFLELENGFGEALAKRLPPDVKFVPAAPEIGFVHRRTKVDEVYFLANTSNDCKTVKATFRIKSMQPEWWDPMTGNVSAADIADPPGDGTVVALDLEPYGSRILVFTKRSLPAHPAAKQVPVVPPALDLSNGWKVTFGKNAKPIEMETLRSWTDDEATRFFSGTATYEKQITVPSEMFSDGLKLRLDFGESKPMTAGGRGRMQALIEAPVREAAVVYVNDKRAGSVWCPPYWVDVTGFITSGENRIRIVVANLAINYMAGHPLPDYKALIARYGDRFQPQDMDQVKPVTAGLVSSIRLQVKQSHDR